MTDSLVPLVHSVFVNENGFDLDCSKEALVGGCTIIHVEGDDRILGRHIAAPTVRQYWVR